MGKRRKYTADLKARVALETLHGEHTIAEIASPYGVHPNLVTNWKRQARESLPDVFSGKPEKREAEIEAQIRVLHEKIGQLTVERDFLEKGFVR